VGYVAVMARCVLGLIFLFSAKSKLGRDAFPRFADSLQQYGVPPARSRAVAAAVVVVEVAIPILLVLPTTVVLGLGFALATLAIFTPVIVSTVRRGIRTPCRCFGASSAPLGSLHIARNTALILTAGAGILAEAAAPPAPLHPGGLLVSLVAGLGIAGFIMMSEDIADLFRRRPVPPPYGRG
jgi:hypothetical protein